MSRSAARNTHKQRSVIVCLSPDVCMTPRGNKEVPVPYMIISELAWSERTDGDVSFGGAGAFTMQSRTQSVTGNEAGTGGGVISGVNVGWCRPQSNKASVVISGQAVIEDGCLFDMNCAGPEGPANTMGRLIFDDRVDTTGLEKQSSDEVPSR